MVSNNLLRIQKSSRIVLVNLCYFFSSIAKARVRFTQTSYTVLEAPEICVEVGNDMPLSNRFTVDFTFSKYKN